MHDVEKDYAWRFRLLPREYQKQLIAGYSKNTHVNGLVAHWLIIHAFVHVRRLYGSQRSPGIPLNL
jgi:hypothetical protein